MSCRVDLPGHLGHDEAGAVADRVGLDVLVGVGAAGDGAGVQAGLVGEGRGADVGLLRVQGDVDQLGDVVATPAVSRSSRSSGMVRTPIFSVRLGMIVVRLALPVRSP